MSDPAIPSAEVRVERPVIERCVLCVDDDYAFLKSLEFFLPEQINKHCGGAISYRFIFLAEPREALEALRELVTDGETVAMLITDQKMPNMKGTEFLAQARELVPDSTRILLTGHSGIDAAIVGINEQLLDKYLTKPIESEHDFMLSVKHLLDRFELQRRVEQQNRLIHGLYEFANTLNAAETLNDTMDIVVDFTKATLGCEEVQILLSVARDSSEAAEAGAHAGKTSEKSVRSHAGPVSGLVPRVDDCPGYAELAPGPDQAWPSGRVGYAVLESGGKAFGLVLAWEPRQGTPFDEESLRSLGYIAASASIAIQKQMSRGRLEAISRARAHHLEEARSRLQILDRMKTDFLSFVSHELRTPLNHIAAVDMIDEEMDQVSRTKMVGIVRSGYERLERFIVSSLEYFEWFSPRLEGCDEVTNLAERVQGVLDKVASRSKKPVEWDVRIPAQPCLAVIPHDHADQLLTVLVDNAIKFSPDAPRVRVEVATGGGRVTLTVTDHGQGFPPAWAEEVFRPFTITDSMHHREGTALNLAKVAAMVEAYGGRIQARSAGPGKGATFTVDLPAKSEVHARVIELPTREPGEDLDEETAKAA